MYGVLVVTLSFLVSSTSAFLSRAWRRLAVIPWRLESVNDVNNEMESMSEWVSNLEVSNYGVFEKAEMKLSGRPSFVVITGETGAGKSVLVSALEYALSGSNKRNLLLKSGSDMKGDGGVKESFVSLCLADHEQKKLLGIKRSRSLSGKRSTCQMNGEKITSKALSDQLGGIVKFWTAETSCLVETGTKASSSGAEGNTFLAHVDNNLDDQGLEVLRELPYAYREWRKAYIERFRLERLQESADDGNDASLLEFYIEEVSDLEGSVCEVFSDLLKVLEEYEEIALDGAPLPGPDEDEEVDSYRSTTRALIELVSRALEGPSSSASDMGYDDDDGYDYGGSASQVDLELAWKALRQAEDWAKTLQAALEHSFPDRAGTGGSSGGSGADAFMSGLGFGTGSTGRGRAAAGGGGVDIRDVEDAIEDYVDRLISLQEAMREVGLGVVDAGIDSRIEETHMALQTSLRSVKTATSMLDNLRGAMPDLQSTVEDLTALRMRWEAIRRKHGPGKSSTRSDGGDLAALKCQWGKDVGSLASLESALPQAVAEERKAAQAYRRLAQQLSTARTTAVNDLLSRVNALLPSLEMTGVQVTATVHSVEGSGDNEGVNPLQQTVRADGWDAVFLHASHTPAGAFTTQAQAQPTVGAATSRSASTLSSGENARLALAIESCAISGKESESNNDAQRSGTGTGLESMIVYDEIDAHVGGEAAVAVARLLRQQGSKRQVVAITHNPVIAAAADQHFVVTRTERGASTDNRGEPESHESTEERERARIGRGSKVVEVEGADRESELTRMTTGKLDTSAGLELAKALLKEFQRQ